MVSFSRATIKNELPANYHELPIRDKLYVERSSLPAITHIDFSGRIQTVHKETNAEYWELINEFKKITNVSQCTNNTVASKMYTNNLTALHLSWRSLL